MPKKKRTETAAQQSERFKRRAQELADAGVLNLTDADDAVDEFVRSKATRKGGDSVCGRNDSNQQKSGSDEPGES